MKSSNVKDNSHIGMPITTSTDGESLVFLVGNVINQFSLGLKLVVITSDVGTNLARCKAILDSTFDNTGVLDLGKPMFVMECLSHVLANSCNTGAMDVKFNDGRVYTKGTRRNMKCCITWTKNHKRGQRLWR